LHKTPMATLHHHNPSPEIVTGVGIGRNKMGGTRRLKIRQTSEWKTDMKNKLPTFSW
jgi:hypothetical protein